MRKVLNKIILIMLVVIPLFFTSPNNKSWSIEYTGSKFKDPLKVLIPKRIKEEEYVRPELILQGIVLGGRKSTAIINNTVVSVGDIISGAKILDIRKGAVILLYKGERFILEYSQ